MALLQHPMKRRFFVWSGSLFILFVSTALLFRVLEPSSSIFPEHREVKFGETVVAFGGRDVSPVTPVVAPGDQNRSAPVGTLELPPFSAEELLVAHPPRKGAPLRFAEALPVKITPSSHGRWESRGGRARWVFRIEAPGARNLNLGFSRFLLPRSARLELRVGDELQVRPFTAADNDAHGELWTPVVAGAELELLLEVTQEERSQVQLQLASINRGFRPLSFAAGYWKIGNSAPEGNCHIDVVCSATESGVGPALDQYRDQIKAAGVYTLNGEDTCSGSAVNNARNDGTPYFMTADHCGVRSSNAASMVVYWNHENASCRTPGSGQNGGDGNGPINNFNSGAAVRATYSASDMTLVELDDPIDSDHEVFLAGWSRTGTPEMAVSVHFPNTSEKRISFDFDPLRSTNDYSTGSNPNGTHWMVIDWDHGSTEGGSSGSPIYDQNGRMVGQLSGGDAACGNDEADWYGKFSRGWDGGGAPGSRLRDWLDPDESGSLTLDGISMGLSRVIVADAEISEGDAGRKNLEFTVSLSEAVDQRLNFTYSTENDSAVAGSDYVAASNADFFLAAGQLTKTFAISIEGDTTPEANERFRVALSLQGDASVNVSDAQAWGTIANDDFIVPILVGPAVVNGRVGEDVAVSVVVENTPTAFSLSGAPPGMEIDGQGVISWIPSVPGDFEVTVTIANEAGSAGGGISFTILPNSLDQALDSPGRVGLSSGGAAPFRLDSSSDSRAGNNRAQSGAIGDDSASWLEVAVEGPDYLGFWWKVSSEADYDFLRLTVDGDMRQEISGIRDWDYQVVAIPPGGHTVRWTYSKDVDTREGADLAWVDFLQLASRSMPFLMGPAHVRLNSGGPVEYQFPTSRPGASFTPVQLGSGLSLNAAGEVVGTPLADGELSFTLNIQQHDEQFSIPATVEVLPASAAGEAAYPATGPNWGLAWETSGSGTWISQSDETSDGQAAAAAQGVPHDGRASLSTWVFGPGEVAFSWRVSSERDYDFLYYEVNGQQRESLTGNSGWQEYTEELPYGWHQLTWAYEKDGSDSRRDDTGYLDQISFTGYTGWVLQAGIGQKTGVTLDPDGDGQNLLFEFATGGSATDWDAMPIPVLEDGQLTLESTKRVDTGLHYDAEVSGDLVDWNRSERSILRDDEQVFRVRDQLGVGVANERYLRMTVHPQK